MGEVSPVNQLYARYRDKGFEFLTIYVREPHPGEHYGAHGSWEQKLQYARDCRTRDGIQNPLLVDDLAGTVHRLYGTMPNMVYIIDKNGRVVFKAAWTGCSEIESVLQNLEQADSLRAQGIRLKQSYSERITFNSAEGDTEVRQRVFDRAGPKAWEEYQSLFVHKPQGPGS